MVEQGIYTLIRDMVISLFIVILILFLSLLVLFLLYRNGHLRKSISNNRISYMDIFNAIPDVMGIQDTERRIISYNPAGYQYLGVRPEDAIGRHCYELVGRDTPCEPCSTKEAVQTGKPTSIIKYVPVTDTWFNVRAYPVKDKSGRVDKVVEHLRDITAEKRLQIALENLNRDLENQVEIRTSDLKATIEELTNTQDHLIESEKLSALGRMVAGISHEVSTPLGIAVTSASYIKELMDRIQEEEADREWGEKFRDFFEQLGEACTLANKNLKRAGDLMGGFKRIAADQTSEQLRTVFPLEYLKELELSLVPVLKKRKITTTIDSTNDIPITTYPGALAQIFTNLYMNSLNHAFSKDDAGSINLIISGTSHGVEFVYSDDGCGMDKEVLKHLYEPFYTSRLGSGGIGLGMSIVYNLVVGKLKGSIVCESSPGIGTRFTISIPDLQGTPSRSPAAHTHL